MIFLRKTFECYVTMTVFKPLVIKCSKAEATKTTVSIFFIYLFFFNSVGNIWCIPLWRPDKVKKGWRVFAAEVTNFCLRIAYKLLSQASF